MSQPPPGPDPAPGRVGARPPSAAPAAGGVGASLGGTAAPRWLARVGCVLHRVGREPIGILVPVVALAIMLAAPQMPDMFAGMLRPKNGGGWTLFGLGAPVGLGPAIGFGFAAVFLGLSGWFWSRASLMAPHHLDDTVCRRVARERRRGGGAADDWVWADEWTPRLPLVTVALLAAAPGLLGRQDEGSGPPLLAIAIGLCLNALGFALVVNRHRLGLSGAIGAGRRWRRGWAMRPTGVLLAAPCGGLPTALAVLALSAVGIWVVADRPWWLENRVPTPTAALLALGMAIGWLILALALVRDLVGLLLALVFAPTRWACRPLPARLRFGRPPAAAIWTRPGEIGLANGLGLLVFLGWLYLVPPPFVAANELYAIRRIAASTLDEPAGPCRGASGGSAQSQEAGPRRPCLDEALAAYRDARLAAGHPEDRPMPVVILAAAGGASRAAAWTLSAARMLDKETGGDFGRHLFAISGVSGGSLGAVSYLQYLRAQSSGPGNVDWGHERIDAALHRLATGDLLVASLATYFLNDTFARLVGGAPVLARTDRGLALELAFERHWADQAGLRLADGEARRGLLATFAADQTGWTPHLLLNGTDAASGRRVITSTFRFDPADDVFAASDDLLGILGEDVPAVTAVTNSARFPYVSPAGRFTDREGRNRQVLDGGYFENYGARTAAELAQAVADRSRRDGRAGRGPRLVPIVVVVSNDAEALRVAEDNDDLPLTLERVSVACPNPRLVKGEARSAETTITGRPLYPEADPRTPLPVEAAQRLNRRQSGSFAAEFLAPLVGLYATRGAHGQDALHLLRRDLCPADGEGAPRMFHLALPRPDWEGEAAPMNWVLNDDARNFLLEVAPRLVFNVGQAHALRAAMAEVARRPSPDAGSLQTAGGQGRRLP